MKKIVFVIIIVVVLYFIIGAVADGSCSKNQQSQEYGKSLFQVVTTSRIYYTDQCIPKDGGYELIGYWHTINGKWVHSNETLFLSDKYGNIIIRGKTK